MRILHVNKFLYRRGGAEGYMEDVGALQAAAGHEVTFFGMQHEMNSPQPYSTSFPARVEFEPAPDGAVQRVRAFGRMVWSTSAQRGMDHVVEDFRPDVVHLHNIYHQLSPSVLRPMAKRGIPTLMTLHDYKLACPTYQFLDKGELCQACVSGGLRQAVKRRCKDGSLAASGAAAVETGLHRKLGSYNSVGRLLCPSRFLADVMRRAGVGGDRVRVLNNFVDTDTVAPQQSPGSGVVFAGRLSHEKGVDVLIAAVARLRAAGNPTVLHIAGDGPDRDALEAQAGPALGTDVVFHGRLPKNVLHDLVRSASVAVTPSRWYENQPLAVLEAFACGLPVVATDLGGFSELVDDGVDGRLVAHDDPDALAAALAPLVTDPAIAHAMGRAGRVKVDRGFSPAGHLDTLMTHYDEVAGDMRRAPRKAMR